MPPVADTQLAEQYGVPVSLVTTHRETVLPEGTHWQRDGKRVVWLAPGLSALGDHIAALALEKNDGGGGEPGAGQGGEGAAPAASGDAGEGDEGGPAAGALPEAPEREKEGSPAALEPRRPTANARILSKHPNPIWVRCHIPGVPGPTFDVRIRNSGRVGKNSVIPVEQLPDGTWICVHPQHSPKPFA